MSDKPEGYSKTDVFEVIDHIANPHPYMITPKHIVHASDNYSGILSKSAIEGLENMEGKGCCGVKDCCLTYGEHEKVLLVEVNSSKQLEDIKEELETYLISIREKAEEAGYVGFAFKQKEASGTKVEQVEEGKWEIKE